MRRAQIQLHLHLRDHGPRPTSGRFKAPAKLWVDELEEGAVVPDVDWQTDAVRRNASRHIEPVCAQRIGLGLQSPTGVIRRPRTWNYGRRGSGPNRANVTPGSHGHKGAQTLVHLGAFRCNERTFNVPRGTAKQPEFQGITTILEWRERRGSNP